MSELGVVLVCTSRHRSKLDGQATLTCGGCGKVLPTDWLDSGSGHPPCPDCGSVHQHVNLEFFDEIPVRPRDSLKGEVVDPSLRSKDKVRKEFFYGYQERKSVGDYIYKERELDRDENRYRELVREEGGKIIREVDHPLSEHTGHGSAKFKSTLPEPKLEPEPESRAATDQPGRLPL